MKTNTLNRFVSVILTVLLIATFFAAGSGTTLAASAAKFVLVPSTTKPVTIGTTFTVDVQMYTPDEALNAAQCYLTFPANLLTLKSISYAKSVFPMQFEKGDVGAGYVHMQRGVPQPGYKGTNGHLATLTFVAKANGMATIVLDPKNQMLTNAGSHNIMVPGENLNIRVGTVSTTVILKIGDKNVYVNGKKNIADAVPMIKNSRTFLPIRVIIEGIGGKITWDSVKRQVTIVEGKHTIVLTIDKNTAAVNGSTKKLDDADTKIAPFILDGRTFLPLRFIAESLGFDVDWANATQTITLTR